MCMPRSPPAPSGGKSARIKIKEHEKLTVLCRKHDWANYLLPRPLPSPAAPRGGCRQDETRKNHAKTLPESFQTARPVPQQNGPISQKTSPGTERGGCGPNEKQERTPKTHDLPTTPLWRYSLVLICSQLLFTGVHVNQDLIWCVTMGVYMGFWVHGGSWLIWSPVNSNW